MSSDNAARHRNLLHDFLDLQKEFVLKKRRREALKKKKATLMAEVRFLREKYRQLLEMRSGNSKKEPDLLDRPQSSIASHVWGSEPIVGKTYLHTELHPLLANVIEESKRRHQGQAVLHSRSLSLAPSKKKVRTSSIGEHGKAKKKKVTWKDQQVINT